MNSFFSTLGLMSGTSMDGLDIAHCTFNKSQGSWNSAILTAKTIKYPETWQKRLSEAPSLSGESLAKLNIDYGLWIGEQVMAFIKENEIEIDMIGSHGHTVFHQPERSFTLQIGSGEAIYSICRIPVVSDFRTIDVLLGGQGAPLVPIGDKFLYPNYDYKINLGGFANISCNRNNDLIAFDICPLNIVLNKYAEKLGFSYDDKGKAASSGQLNQKLLNDLNKLNYYEHAPPKSLGKEWVDKWFLPLIPTELAPKDVLCTLNHHMAYQIAKVISEDTDLQGKKTILITGGGAYNEFFVQTLKGYLPDKGEIIIPDMLTIEYKEAEIFAFLAVLKWNEEPGNVKTVTGASEEIPLGTIHKH